MPILKYRGKLRKRVEALENGFASGYTKRTVFGISTGWGGDQIPIFIPTLWVVSHAVANLAREYELTDLQRLYYQGEEVAPGEIKISYPDSGNGFFVEYRHPEPVETWECTFNWLAVRDTVQSP